VAQQRVLTVPAGTLHQLAPPVQARATHHAALTSVHQLGQRSISAVMGWVLVAMGVISLSAPKRVEAPVLMPLVLVEPIGGGD
jgi:hypothetical protein